MSRRAGERLVAATVLAMILAGCGHGGGGESQGSTAVRSGTGLPDAARYASGISRIVPSVTKVTSLTPQNDPNDLLGRPDGYESAAVLTDRAGDSSDPAPGVEDGATLEMFTTSTAASKRSRYIQKSFADEPVLGSEYDYLHGRVLLRVSGKLSPAVAEQYRSALGSLP